MSEENQTSTSAAFGTSVAVDAPVDTPKKRGRPSKAEQQAREAALAAEAVRALENIAANAPRRRGRPSNTEKEAREAAQTAMESIVHAPRKRGRPSNTDKAARAAALAALETLSGVPRKRGRPSKEEQQARDQTLAVGTAALIDVLPTVFQTYSAEPAIAAGKPIIYGEEPAMEMQAPLAAPEAPAIVPEPQLVHAVVTTPEAIPGPQPEPQAVFAAPVTPAPQAEQATAAPKVVSKPETEPPPVTAPTAVPDPEQAVPSGPESATEATAEPVPTFNSAPQAPPAPEDSMGRKNKRHKHRHGGKSKAAKVAMRTLQGTATSGTAVPSTAEDPACAGDALAQALSAPPAAASGQATLDMEKSASAMAAVAASAAPAPSAESISPTEPISLAKPETDSGEPTATDPEPFEETVIRKGRWLFFHFSFWPTILMAYIFPAISAMTVTRPNLFQYFDVASALSIFVPVGVLISAVVLYFALYEKHYYLAKGFLWGAIVSVTVPIIITLLALGSCIANVMC